jgi:hypothetical protein
VNQESLGLIAWHDRAELLDRPRRRRMRRHVPMEDPARAHFNTTNTYTVWNIAVTATKKSHGRTAPAWLRTKVLHR